MIWTLLTLIVIWIICGILAYGRSLAFWQREFPTLAKRDYTGDRNMSLLIAVLGPIGFFLSCVIGYARHGLMYTRPYESKMSDFLIG